ncbi:MAG: cation diffusion facilitator family transporter [Chitinispirillales bacterium]|jgi:cation diffusion facilitator family transporter|nr:cation diffusion facilitator family transporter [Chitinispirillales bacterium]
MKKNSAAANHQHCDKAAIRLANRVSVVTIVMNVVLSALKLAAGILANSAAMISDAVHTLSDLFSTFIVIIGVNYAGRKSDEKHRYGHERFECVASIILAMVLGLTGAWIGWSGIKLLSSGDFEGKVPGALALVAAVVSIAIKEWMYWYTRAAAKKTNSGALMADAWHHRSDALSSIGAFIGIGGAMIGFPMLDSVASLVICIFIMKAAYDIFTDAIDKMVDKSCDDKTIAELKTVALSRAGVIAIDDIRTRIFGNKIFVDIEISADKSLTLAEAHEIAEDVHDAIENTYPLVKHCMVHVNPGNV